MLQVDRSSGSRDGQLPNAPRSFGPIFLGASAMTFTKSALLGTAAGFAAISGAQAADLPSKKSAAVEYVRVCSAYGAGFFYIPGTETCLRVGGRVRAEYTVSERWNGLAGTQDQDAYGFRGRGRLNIDARTQTAYGTLRTFVRFEGTIANGVYGQGINGAGPAFTGTRGGAGGQTFNLDKAFIQFGPITAGRTYSFFDFYTNELNYGLIRTSETNLNLLAYTATFGSGFSATISLEDRSEREANLTAASVAANGGISAANIAGSGLTAIGGQTLPDLVGSLNLTQGWGSFQLAGAITQRNAFGVGVSDKTGYALLAGLKINLPMLAAGDVLWLQAAYTEGAISYLGYGGAGAGVTWGAASRAGRLNISNADAFTSTAGGMTSQKLTKGYALTAGLLHYWTPSIRQGVYGSYSKLDYSSAISNLDPREFRIGSSLIWSPVSSFDIGVEVLYAKVEVRNFAPANGVTGARLIKSDDSLSGRLRIQRDF
jgi:Porin subfamily